MASVSAAASAVPRVLRCIWALKDVICFFWFFLFPLFFRGPPLGAESGLIDTTKKAHEGK